MKAVLQPLIAIPFVGKLWSYLNVNMRDEICIWICLARIPLSFVGWDIPLREAISLIDDEVLPMGILQTSVIFKKTFLFKKMQVNMASAICRWVC